MKSSEYGAPVDGEDETLGIGALAERFGLATRVLRHWEAMGLLAPSRNSAGRRRYGSAHLTRVAVILRAKEAGLSLDTIRTLSATADPAQRRDILREEAEALRSRIAAAQESLELIECALDCEHDDFTQCAHFRQMVTERIGTDDAAPTLRRRRSTGLHPPKRSAPDSRRDRCHARQQRRIRLTDLPANTRAAQHRTTMPPAACYRH